MKNILEYQRRKKNREVILQSQPIKRYSFNPDHFIIANCNGIESEALLNEFMHKAVMERFDEILHRALQLEKEDFEEVKAKALEDLRDIEFDLNN